MKRARFSQRLVAYLIDNAILGAVYAVLSVIVGTALGLGGFITPDGGVSTNDPLNALTSLAALIYAFILWALQFLYFGYFFSTGGRTPGKRIMGIKVEERDGGSLSFLRGACAGLSVIGSAAWSSDSVISGHCSMRTARRGTTKCSEQESSGLNPKLAQRAAESPNKIGESQ